MSDSRTRRISRELFLAAIGGRLGALEPWVTDRLAALLEEEEVAAGDCVFAAGDPPDHFYFVRQGNLELVRDGQLVQNIEGPRAFGMLDALVERPRSHSAYARTTLQLLRVRMDPWLELLEDSFELARMSVQRLARNVAALEEKLWASRRPPTPPSLVFDGGGARLDVVERLAVLMQPPPLRGAGAQPISDLATLCEEVCFAPEERLFERGASEPRTFVLIDGCVQAARDEPHVSWQGGPGQMVCGVVSLVERGLEWEARAVTRTRALAFRIDDWFDVMEENFEMVRATMASLIAEQERLGGEL